MTFNTEKLKSLARPMNDSERAKIDFTFDNEMWLRSSVAIAMSARKTMKAKNLSRLDLAALMDLSLSRINEILSGRENLTLKTIARLEDALETKLINL